jgi:SNF2 family DNA or RNA helicase/SAM-dependent methyltransferase
MARKKAKAAASPLELVGKKFHKTDGSVVPFRDVLRDYVAEEGIFREGDGSWKKLHDAIDREARENGKEFNRALLDKLRSDPQRYKKLRDIFLRNREIEASREDAREMEDETRAGKYGDFWQVAKAFDFDQRRISDALYILYPDIVMDPEAAYHIVTRLVSGRVSVQLRDPPEDPLEDLKVLLRRIEPDRLAKDKTLAKLCLDAAEERILPDFSEGSERALEKLRAELEQTPEGPVRYVLEHLIRTYGEVSRLHIAGSVDKISDSESGLLLGFPSIHQKVGIKKILDQKRVIIADEMGVGKTAQAILAFVELRNREPDACHKAIVICPAGVLEHWKNELQAYLTPEMHGSIKTITVQSHNKKSALGSMAEADIVFISYDMLIRDDGGEKIAEKLASLNFSYLVLDEVHRAKNPSYTTKAALAVSAYIQGKKKMAVVCSPDSADSWSEELARYVSAISHALPVSIGKDIIVTSENPEPSDELAVYSENDFDEYAACQRSALVHKLVHSGGAEYVILLSGTPMPNRISDIGNIASILEPDSFPDARTFNERAVTDPSIIRQLFVRRMVRRRVHEVMKLPPLEIERREIRLDDNQQQAYQIIQENRFNLSVAEKLVWQRMATINPGYLCQMISRRMETANDEEKTALRELWSAANKARSVKFDEALRIVKEANGSKTVIFSSVLREGIVSELSGLLEKSGVGTVFIDGTVATGKDGGEREKARKEFLSPEGPDALVAMLKTMNEGISLTKATTALFLDYPYNDAESMQGVARLWRRGQKNAVRAIFLCAPGTIDENAELLIREKARIARLLIDGIPPTDEERALFENTFSLRQGPFADALKTPRQILGEHIGRMANKGAKANMEYLTSDGGKNGKAISDLYLFRWEKSFSGNTARALSILIDSIEESEGMKFGKIADLGSGPGIVSRSSGRVTTCIDINPFVLARARADLAGLVETHEASMDALPLDSESHDLSVISLSLHQSLSLPIEGEKPGERERSVREALRITKSGGWLIISEPIKQVNEEGARRMAKALESLGLEKVRFGQVRDADGGSFRAFVILGRKSGRPQSELAPDSFIMNTELNIRNLRGKRNGSGFPSEEGTRVENFEFSGMDDILDAPRKRFTRTKTSEGYVISAAEYLRRHEKTIDRRLDDLISLNDDGGKDEAYRQLDELAEYDAEVKKSIGTVDPDMLDKARDFSLKRRRNGS